MRKRICWRKKRIVRSNDIKRRSIAAIICRQSLPSFCIIGSIVTEAAIDAAQPLCLRKKKK